jgi:hypothetical protein
LSICNPNIRNPKCSEIQHFLRADDN